MTTEHDPVHTYLISRGCAPLVVRRGLSGLLEHWATIVAAVERGRDASLDEWLNDMDLRDILAGALAAAGPRERRAAALRLPVGRRNRHHQQLAPGMAVVVLPPPHRARAHAA
jgi:hypothetical protein